MNFLEPIISFFFYTTAAAEPSQSMVLGTQSSPDENSKETPKKLLTEEKELLQKALADKGLKKTLDEEVIKLSRMLISTLMQTSALGKEELQKTSNLLNTYKNFQLTSIKTDDYGDLKEFHLEISNGEAVINSSHDLSTSLSKPDNVPLVIEIIAAALSYQLCKGRVEKKTETRKKTLATTLYDISLRSGGWQACSSYIYPRFTPYFSCLANSKERLRAKDSFKLYPAANENSGGKRSRTIRNFVQTLST